MLLINHDCVEKYSMQLHRCINIFQNRILLSQMDAKKRKILKDNIKYLDRYNGKRCFIMGNGPSVNKIDFNRLSDELVITVNDMVFHKNFNTLNSNFHVLADQAYFKLDKNDVGQAQLIQQMKRLAETNTTLMFPIHSMDVVKKYGWYRKIEISYYLGELYFYDDYKEKIDFTECIPGFCAVIHWCIAFAVYLGCDEIYLLGCDMTNIVSDLLLFIKKDAASNYGYELPEECDDFGKKFKLSFGLEGKVRSHSLILKGFSEMYKYCIRNNVKIFNCSEESILECIPKKKLEDVL